MISILMLMLVLSLMPTMTFESGFGAYDIVDVDFLVDDLIVDGVVH